MSNRLHVLRALTVFTAALALGAEPDARPPTSTLSTSQMRAGIVAKLSYDHEYFTGLLKAQREGKRDARLSKQEWERELQRARNNVPILEVFFAERAAFEQGKPLTMPPRDNAHRVYANLVGLLNMLQAYDKNDFERVLTFGERIVVSAKTDLGVVRGEDAKYYLDLYREYFWFMAAGHYRLGHDREAVSWLSRIDSDLNVQALKQELAKTDSRSPAERLQALYARPVAVVNLVDLAPVADTKWVGAGFAEVFTTDLQRFTGLTVMERPNVDRVLGEVTLAQVGLTEEKNAKKLATQLAAGAVLAGTYRFTGADCALWLDLLDGDTGRSLAHAEGHAPKDALFDKGREVLLALLRDAGWLSEDAANELRAARAPSADTIRALLEARLLLASKSDQARALYTKAVKESPEYARAFADVQQQFKGVNPLVAVMPFANVTGREDDGWMAVGAAEALNTDLPNIGFTLVERTQLGALLKEEDVGQVLGEAKSHELARRLGADFLVLGSVMHPPQRVRVDCRFVDVSTGVVVQTFAEEGKEAELTTVLGRLSAAVARRFNTRLTEAELKQLAGNRLGRDEFERLARAQLLERQLVKQHAVEEKQAVSHAPTWLAGAGVLVGAAAAGTAFYVAAQSAGNTAYIEGLQAVASSPADQARLETQRVRSASTTTGWLVGGFVGVGVAVGSAIVLVARQLQEPTASVEVKAATLVPSFSVAPGQVGVGLGGTF